MATAFKLFFSAVPAVITFLGTLTWGCDDVGGLSSWQRCRSALGNPIIEWPGGDVGIVFPLLIAIAVGAVAWWLQGRSVLFRQH